MKTSDIFLKHVVPILGGCIAIGMYASPMMAVQRVRKTKALGDLNPIPYPLIFANCIGWVAYSYLLQDAYIFVPNAVGVVLGLYMTASTLPHATFKVQDAMNFIQVAVAALVMVVGAATTMPEVSHGTAKLIWGIECVVVLMFYYSAPLSTLQHVISSRSSATLFWPLCAMNTVNGTLWFVYGLAIKDWFIAAPNGLGAAMALCALALCFVFPPHNPRKHQEDAMASVEAGNGAVAVTCSSDTATLEQWPRGLEGGPQQLKDVAS